MSEVAFGRRLRSALIVAGLLLPTACAFPVLASLAPSPLRWLVLALWVVAAAALGIVVYRIRLLLAQRSAAEESDTEGREVGSR